MEVKVIIHFRVFFFNVSTIDISQSADFLYERFLWQYDALTNAYC